MTSSSRTRGWRKTIALKHLLSTDESAANARRVANEFAVILKRTSNFRGGQDDELREIVDEFEGISTSTPDDYDENLRPVDHFNDCLARLYDWADAERVWIA